MRILILANSYPTAAVPSGAPYMSARVRCLHAQPEVEATALALRPTYSLPARLLRAAGRAASDSSLALAPDAGTGWVEAPVRWGVPDLIAVRRGRRPDAAVARATRQVLDLVATGRSRFDVVHAHGMYAMPAGEVARRVAAELAVPFLVSLHGSDVEEAMAAHPAPSARTLRQAAATVYVSEALRRRAVELGAPEQHSHVIPNGVDSHVFARRALSEPAHPAGAGGPTLLFVGNLLPVKGADRLAGIVEEVARQRPGVRLVVAGDGPERARLAERLGSRVDLRGRVAPEEVARLMAEADALLVPSRREGWGCVVTESYSVGLPVVASAVGGLPEAVIGAEALVEPGPEEDVTARFAQRVLEVVDHPPAAADMAAHVAAASWESVVERELAVLRAVVRGS